MTSSASCAAAERPTVRSIVDSLRKAKADSRIRAVLLKPTGFDSPFWGKVQEIRDALLEFKKSGKPLYAYLEYGGDREYYLATAADKVFLLPSSTLDLSGVATYELFLRGTLDKIGAFPDLHHIGDYKTYSNTFTEKGYTPAHREMDQSLNRDIYEQLVRGIADGRRKDEAEIRRLIDDGPFLPEDALRAGLVDDVAYEDQVHDKLGSGPSESRVDGDDYARVSTGSLGLNRGPRIAVIYASGTINSGKSGYDRDQRCDCRIGHAERVHPSGAARQVGARDRAAHRQSGRIGRGIRCDLARVDDHAQRTHRSSAHCVDVGPRRVGRVLHRHAGAGDRRAAVDADRVDRRRRRQVRHRRRLREARRAHRLDQHRPARRNQFAGAPATIPRS